MPYDNAIPIPNVGDVLGPSHVAPLIENAEELLIHHARTSGTPLAAPEQAGAGQLRWYTDQKSLVVNHGPGENYKLRDSIQHFSWTIDRTSTDDHDASTLNRTICRFQLASPNSKLYLRVVGTALPKMFWLFDWHNHGVSSLTTSSSGVHDHDGNFETGGPGYGNPPVEISHTHGTTQNQIQITIITDEDSSYFEVHGYKILEGDTSPDYTGGAGDIGAGHAGTHGLPPTFMVLKPAGGHGQDHDFDYAQSAAAGQHRHRLTPGKLKPAGDPSDDQVRWWGGAAPLAIYVDSTGSNPVPLGGIVGDGTPEHLLYTQGAGPIDISSLGSLANAGSHFFAVAGGDGRTELHLEVKG